MYNAYSVEISWSTCTYIVQCDLCFLCADMYLLSEGPEAYHYLSQSGCMQDSSLDDKQLFDSVMVRMAL